jgi:hypothetical protein
MRWRMALPAAGDSERFVDECGRFDMARPCMPFYAAASDCFFLKPDSKALNPYPLPLDEIEFERTGTLLRVQHGGSETIKLFRATSMEQEEDVDENQNVNEKVSEEYVEKAPRPRDLDDGSIE